MTGSTAQGGAEAVVTPPINLMTTNKKTLNMSSHQGGVGMMQNVIQYDSMQDARNPHSVSTLNDLHLSG
jgi:hypothetical protein